jgi:hypothetical protein
MKHVFISSCAQGDCEYLDRKMHFIRRDVESDRSNDRRYKEARLMRPLYVPKEKIGSYVDLRRWMTPIEHQQDMNTWLEGIF